MMSVTGTLLRAKRPKRIDEVAVGCAEEGDEVIRRRAFCLAKAGVDLVIPKYPSSEARLV